MNNIQLSQEFDKITKLDNSLNIVCALSKLKKQYKKSDFFKQTHLSINRAYMIYLSDGLIALYKFLHSPVFKALGSGKAEELSDLVETYLSEFDYTKLDGLFDYLTAKFENLNLDNSQLFEIVKKELQNFRQNLE